MSNLIITIIAISLMAVLALGAVYYGAYAWSKSRNRAEAVTLINQSEQIEGASSLYRGVKNKKAKDLQADLVDNEFLSSIPVFKETVWDSEGYKIYVENNEDPTDFMNICNYIYEEKNNVMNYYNEINTIPLCSSIGVEDVCCEED